MEHAFGRTAQLFPFVHHAINNKLLQNRDVIHYYEVATILRNINVILYGGISSEIYKNYQFPTVEDYLSKDKTEIECIDSYDRIEKHMRSMYLATDGSDDASNNSE